MDIQEARALLEGIEDEYEPDAVAAIRRYETMYPKVNGQIDGWAIRPGIDNQSSIDASLTDYYILPGIRRVPIHDANGVGFEGKSSYRAVYDINKVEKLMALMAASKSISPLIIVEERKGPYVLEGGHRMSALVELGARAVPAMVILDMDDLFD